jgi:hypothetical protein
MPSSQSKKMGIFAKMKQFLMICIVMGFFCSTGLTHEASDDSIMITIISIMCNNKRKDEKKILRPMENGKSMGLRGAIG